MKETAHTKYKELYSLIYMYKWFREYYPIGIQFKKLKIAPTYGIRQKFS